MAIGTRYTLDVHLSDEGVLTLDSIVINKFSYDDAFSTVPQVTKNNLGDSTFDAYTVKLVFSEGDEPDQGATTLLNLLRQALAAANDAYEQEIPQLVDPAVDVTERLPYFIVYPFITSSGDITAPVEGDLLTVNFTGAGHEFVAYQWATHDVQEYLIEDIVGASEKTFSVTSAELGLRLRCTMALVNTTGPTIDTTANETGKVIA